MRPSTRTKIVATLGPSSNREEQIAALLDAGVDVFRFNFSHGTRADHGERFRIIRKLEAARGRPIGILADLQGPKLRVGRFAGGKAKLTAGQAFRLDLDAAPGDERRVELPHPEIFAALHPGAELLLDDGKLRLLVTACNGSHAETRVVVGGVLSDCKGVNLPNVALNISALTQKDRADLAFALDLGISMVALSFVQRPQDLEEARAAIGGRANLLAKLEKPEALKQLDRIIDLADGIMVARGDLGVELPPEDVPVLQRRIVGAARRAGKPVIVATQMLESMMAAPTPTRAEASDVATAVYEGADAVMLSGETAAGAYPIEAAAIMERIVARAEKDPSYHRTLHIESMMPLATGEDAVTAAARQVAETVGAAAIVTFTLSGKTTLRAARERPSVPILALTPSERVARGLCLAWGVRPLVRSQLGSLRAMIAEAGRAAVAVGAADPGALIVLVSGFPPGVPVNTLHITEIPVGPHPAAPA